MVHMLEIVRQVGKVDFPQVIVSNFSTSLTHILLPYFNTVGRSECFYDIQQELHEALNLESLIKARSVYPHTAVRWLAAAFLF